MFGQLAHNHATKPSNPSPRASAESLLEALRARDELTPKRRDQEPCWSLLIRRLCRDAEDEARLVVELGHVWFLPFIHLDSAVNL